MPAMGYPLVRVRADLILWEQNHFDDENELTHISHAKIFAFFALEYSHLQMVHNGAI